MICPRAEDPAWFTLSEWAFTDPGNRPQTGDRSQIGDRPQICDCPQIGDRLQNG